MTHIESFTATQLAELLDEEQVTARERERTTWDHAVAPFGDALVLFGAGGLGRKVLAGLRSVGIEPLAFADNNHKAWHTMIDGLPVLPPAEAAAEYGQRAAFVVTIWRAGGGHRLAHTQQQLQALNCAKVVSFAPLFWKYPATFGAHYCLDLPSKVLAQRDLVQQAYELWTDEASRAEYLAQLRWRIWLDFDGLPSPVAHEQYFPEDLFQLQANEVFVDCGAYDGDTLKSFVQRREASFAQVWALEPDPINFDKMQEYVTSLPTEISTKLQLWQLAAGARRETVYFEITGTAASSVSETGTLAVDCVPLDELLAETAPTFIKMDIEGAEPDALAGGQQTIQRHAPVLAICVYHQQDHLWRIPLLMQSLSSQYRLFLRPHNEEGWDLICYAIPVDRLINETRGVDNK